MIDMIAQGVFGLATLIADEISKKTGADKAVTYEVAIKVASEWVEAERAAVAEARAKALKRVGG